MEFDDLPRFVDGGVILPAVIVGLRQHGVIERGDGVKVEGRRASGEASRCAPPRSANDNTSWAVGSFALSSIARRNSFSAVGKSQS